jgi:hypothetical protein
VISGTAEGAALAAGEGDACGVGEVGAATGWSLSTGPSAGAEVDDGAGGSW